MTPFRYCLTLGAAAIAIAGAIATFNYTVDPYLLFDGQRAPGFNDLKPSVATRERMMKAYQIERASARTIVIGSSRPDLGIDPATQVWPVSARPVYNLGLVGSDVTDGLKYVRHYVATQPGRVPKTLVVGLDFESYLYVPSAAVPGTNKVPPMNELEERLAVDPSGNPNPKRSARVLKDRALGLLSLDALGDSIQTIRANRSATAISLEPNGHLSEAAMRSTANADGYALVFDQKNLDTVKHYAKPHRVLSDTPDGPIREFEVLKELLAFAKSHDIDVVLTIQPAHVSRLELLDRMGYWDSYERWKRELVVLVAQTSPSQKVTLWDFGGYERQAQEAVPTKGAGARTMQWFWDPVHYTSKLGDTIIARIFDTTHDNDFGVVLTPENVEAQLAKIRRDREAFRAAMPQETTRLERLACGTSPCPAPAKTLAAAR
jgi:hypothetical protein